MNKIQKALIAITSAMLISTSVIAEDLPQPESQPDPQRQPLMLPLMMPCNSDASAMFDMLTNKYNEAPIALGIGTIMIPGGRSIKGQITLWYNQEDKKTFSIVFVAQGTNIGCMIVSGDSMELLPVAFGQAI